jgi:hypothetical protein
MYAAELANPERQIVAAGIEAQLFRARKEAGAWHVSLFPGYNGREQRAPVRMLTTVDLIEHVAHKIGEVGIVSIYPSHWRDIPVCGCGSGLRNLNELVTNCRV